MPVLEGPLNLFARALSRFLFLCTLKDDGDTDYWFGFKADYLTDKLPDLQAEAVWELVLYHRYSRDNEDLSDFLIDVILPKVVYCLTQNQDTDPIDLLLVANSYIKKDPDFDYMTWRNAKQILTLAKCILNNTSFYLYNTSDEESSDSSDYSS